MHQGNDLLLGSFAVVSGVFDVTSTETLWMNLYQEIAASRQKYSIVAAASSSPLVSVVITHFNRPTLLRLAIESINNQDYSNVELVVVDDGSTEQTAIDFIDQLQTNSDLFCKFPMTVIKSSNEYLGAARNRGVKATKGEFIMFLDDDNYAKANQISTYVKVIQQTGADSLTAIHDVFEGQGVPTQESVMYRWLPVGPALSVALFRNPFGDANTLFISKRAFASIGGFTEDRDVGAEDYEFNVRLTLAGKRQLVVPESLVYYRKHNVDQMVDSTDQLSNQLRSLRPFANAGLSEDVLVVAARNNLQVDLIILFLTKVP
jgi:glycosyltransferase involved in cell wall biosynthesis